MSKSNKNSDQPEGEDSKSKSEPQSTNKRRIVGRTLTSKDAGWRSPGVFIAPAKFTPIDPPEPRQKRHPPNEPVE